MLLVRSGTFVTYQMHLFWKGCPPGQFGIGCREGCSGHCINNEPCDHISGVCSTGCRDGFVGSYCTNCKKNASVIW